MCVLERMCVKNTRKVYAGTQVTKKMELKMRKVLRALAREGAEGQRDGGVVGKVKEGGRKNEKRDG